MANLMEQPVRKDCKGEGLGWPTNYPGGLRSNPAAGKAASENKPATRVPSFKNELNQLALCWPNDCSRAPTVRRWHGY